MPYQGWLALDYCRPPVRKSKHDSIAWPKSLLSDTRRILNCRHGIRHSYKFTKGAAVFLHEHLPASRHLSPMEIPYYTLAIHRTPRTHCFAAFIAANNTLASWQYFFNSHPYLAEGSSAVLWLGGIGQHPPVLRGYRRCRPSAFIVKYHGSTESESSALPPPTLPHGHRERRRAEMIQIQSPVQPGSPNMPVFYRGGGATGGERLVQATTFALRVDSTKNGLRSYHGNLQCHRNPDFF